MACPSKTWKSRERKLAESFGTKRTPLSGSNSGHNTSSDSLHPTIYMESKYRKRHSVLTLYRETEEKANKENKIPVVALSEKGKAGFWLLIHQDNLIQLAEEMKKSICIPSTITPDQTKT